MTVMFCGVCRMVVGNSHTSDHLDAVRRPNLLSNIAWLVVFVETDLVYLLCYLVDQNVIVSAMFATGGLFCNKLPLHVMIIAKLFRVLPDLSSSFLNAVPGLTSPVRRHR